MKCEKKNADMHDHNRHSVNIHGINGIDHPGNNNCDSSNVPYLLMCSKSNYVNYEGKTSKQFQLGRNSRNKAFETTTEVCRFNVAIKLITPSMTFHVSY